MHVVVCCPGKPYLLLAVDRGIKAPVAHVPTRTLAIATIHGVAKTLLPTIAPTVLLIKRILTAELGCALISLWIRKVPTATLIASITTTKVLVLSIPLRAERMILMPKLVTTTLRASKVLLVGWTAHGMTALKTTGATTIKLLLRPHRSVDKLLAGIDLARTIIATLMSKISILLLSTVLGVLSMVRLIYTSLEPPLEPPSIRSS